MTTEIIVAKVIEKLDQSMGPSITDLPIKIIKNIRILVPIITKMFNLCIANNVIPYLNEINAKMFADYTTLYLVSEKK